MHSGAIMALFGATGWNKIPVATGAVYPLFILAEGRTKKRNKICVMKV